MRSVGWTPWTRIMTLYMHFHNTKPTNDQKLLTNQCFLSMKTTYIHQKSCTQNSSYAPLYLYKNFLIYLHPECLQSVLYFLCKLWDCVKTWQIACPPTWCTVRLNLPETPTSPCSCSSTTTPTALRRVQNIPSHSAENSWLPWSLSFNANESKAKLFQVTYINHFTFYNKVLKTHTNFPHFVSIFSPPKYYKRNKK